MFIVEDGTGLSNSNSYCSVQDFLDYWSARGIAHDSLDESKIEQALVQATQYIDKSYRYIGQRPSLEQALNWPRFYAYSPDGFMYSGLPNEIVYATCEAASLVINDVELFASAESGITSKTENVGPVQTTYHYAKEQTGRIVYQAVIVYLRDLIKGRSNRIRRY